MSPNLPIKALDRSVGWHFHGLISESLSTAIFVDLSFFLNYLGHGHLDERERDYSSFRAVDTLPLLGLSILGKQEDR